MTRTNKDQNTFSAFILLTIVHVCPLCILLMLTDTTFDLNNILVNTEMNMN